MLTIWNVVLVFVVLTNGENVVSEVEEPCESNIYCYGRLLHTVQMSGLYEDGKEFVDRPLKFLPEEVHQNFSYFMRSHSYSPKKEDIRRFVDANFHPNGHELDGWQPEDWQENPKFLESISDPSLRAWAFQLNFIWCELGRKIKSEVKSNPAKHSIIYVSNPFIVPGGRFREYYYWDSYWIQKGLLVSEMSQTVKGMLENFIELVNSLGYVPNGGRIYMQRSQPPLLIPMMKNYLDATGDITFIEHSLPTLEKEFSFWMQNRTVEVKVQGKSYHLARYNSEKKGPRPESYRVDYTLASKCKTKLNKDELYFNMHSTAESGWDFSSRWFITPEHQPGSRINTKTRHIIPVDLNAILYLNAVLLSDFYVKVNNKTKGTEYKEIAEKLKESITAVLWNEQFGSWFDYDLINGRIRTGYTAASIVPIWAGLTTAPEVLERTLNYLQSTKVFDFPGGVPATLNSTGEQWDFPNGWAPLQHLMIDALEKTGNSKAQDLAFRLAEKWVISNYKAFYESQPNAMFEKYNVTVIGLPGGGGEYGVAVGFGWSNGVVLDLLARYRDRLFTSKKRRLFRFIERKSHIGQRRLHLGRGLVARLAGMCNLILRHFTTPGWDGNGSACRG